MSLPESYGDEQKLRGPRIQIRPPGLNFAGPFSRTKLEREHFARCTPKAQVRPPGLTSYELGTSPKY